jgi:hypothetical protein
MLRMRMIVKPVALDAKNQVQRFASIPVLNKNPKRSRSRQTEEGRG